jgi:quercetin dioxygenase-like cupin family protein
MQPVVVHRSSAPRLSVLGDRQAILLSGEATGGAFTLIEEQNDPGTAIPPHVHEREDETFTVLEGEVLFEIRPGEPGAVRHVAGPGTTVFAPRGVPHRWEVVGRAPARVLLHVAPAGCERMFRELAALSSGPPTPDLLPAIAEICARHGVRFV